MQTHRGACPWFQLAPATALSLISVCSFAQSGAPDGQWPNHSGDRGSTKYAALDQIGRENVGDLEIAWRWRTVDTEIAWENRLRPGSFKTAPLMVDGVLYVSTAISQIAAIDAGTGETLWVHDPESYKRGRPANSGFQHRGVAYWTDGTGARIVIATGGRQLVAVNAKTGEPYADFGTDGWVDLGIGLGRVPNEEKIGFNSPPAIVGDTIVVGSIISDGPRMPEMPPGHVRGYDVRTGKMKWIFHTIPLEGELGNDTWFDDSWKYSGNTNVWGPMTVDEELGYVYLPISTPTNDWYGGHRRGDNLFAESIVCLDGETGERVWHFQAVRHGLWDWDFPCPAVLADIMVDGREIKALAQPSKQGFLYVLNRVTGGPVWPIEDRPVPQTGVPGEYTSATQPFPTKPPAFERQGVGIDDLIDFTPELRQEAIEIASRYRLGPLFNPPSLMVEGGTQGSLTLPGAGGGANWPGGAYDPESGIIYIHSNTIPRITGLIKPDPQRSSFRYVRGNPSYIEGPRGLPLLKPPYGRITAIDLNKGEIVWQIAHGDGPRDHPAIKHLNLPPLGAATHRGLTSSGPLVTKTLLFFTQAQRKPDGSMAADGLFLRAFDKANGDVLWERALTQSPNGVPMTYMHEGRQFIVFSTGGGYEGGELLAFALPN